MGGSRVDGGSATAAVGFTRSPRRGGQGAAGGEAAASNRGAEAGPMAQRHAEALREDGRAVRPPEPRPLSGGGGVLADPAKKTNSPPFLDLYLFPTV